MITPLLTGNGLFADSVTTLMQYTYHLYIFLLWKSAGNARLAHVTIHSDLKFTNSHTVYGTDRIMTTVHKTVLHSCDVIRKRMDGKQPLVWGDCIAILVNTKSKTQCWMLTLCQNLMWICYSPCQQPVTCLPQKKQHNISCNWLNDSVTHYSMF